MLAKDKNGRQVRFNKRDYELIKEYGDRYLDRVHHLEYQDAQRARLDKERERLERRKQEYELERQERIERGEELPWLHKKVVREQLEPFAQWNKKQVEKELAEEIRKGSVDKELAKEPDQPIHQETVVAAGRDWSKADKLEDLERLNQHLWDNPNERIPKEDYKKLVGWMREKERIKESAGREKELAATGKEKSSEMPSEQPKDRSKFEHQGQEYSKTDPYEKLAGLAKNLREKTERLPIDNYQRLRKWLEHRDRERFSGVLEKHLGQAKARELADEKTRNSPHAIRYVPELQQQLMKNPIMGLFMTGASIANDLVRSIPLDDRNRDYAKEARDELEGAKKDVEARKATRKTPDEKAGDDQMIDDIEKAIEEQKEERLKQKKKRETEKERQDTDRGLLG